MKSVRLFFYFKLKSSEQLKSRVHTNCTTEGTGAQRKREREKKGHMRDVKRCLFRVLSFLFNWKPDGRRSVGVEEGRERESARESAGSRLLQLLLLLLEAGGKRQVVVRQPLASAVVGFFASVCYCRAQ